MIVLAEGHVLAEVNRACLVHGLAYMHLSPNWYMPQNAANDEPFGVITIDWK